MIYKNITELIGNTPILKIDKYKNEVGGYADIFIKLECFNPAGSVKDRAALHMLNKAISEKIIKEGATIIEPTSGNTGIGLAMVGACYNMKVILTMPDTMSIERRKILSAYGAEIVLTPGKDGMKGAIEKANEIKMNTPNSFIPSQFDNPFNPEAHYLTTASEIWDDMNGELDYFVASVGTGGTFTGVMRALKERNKEIKGIAVEPADLPLITKGYSAPHKIQGIGANFIPENFNKSLADDIFAATTEDAYETVKLLARSEGCFVGISSGASLAAATRLSKMRENAGKRILVLAPDTGTRYLSTEGLID